MCESNWNQKEGIFIPFFNKFNLRYLFFGRIFTKLYFKAQIYYRLKSEQFIARNHKITFFVINDSANHWVC
jgi:hypothetical protein